MAVAPAPATAPATTAATIATATVPIRVHHTYIPWTSEFRRAALSVGCAAWLTAAITFGIGIAFEKETSAFLDPSTKWSIYWTFDLAMFVLFWHIQTLHFSLNFRAVLAYWPVRATRWLTLLLIVLSHIPCIVQPLNQDHSKLANSVSSLTLNIMTPVAIRIGASILLRRRHPGVPIPAGGVNVTSPLFGLVLLSVTTFIGALVVDDNVIAGTLRVACTVAGIGVSTLSLMLQKKLARHIDYPIIIYLAYSLSPMLQGAAVQLTTSQWGRHNIVTILFCYRLILSAFSFLLDDMMQAAFGSLQLWGSFFLRVAESYISCTTTINNTVTMPDALVYMATNFAMSLFKDSGLADDLRFALINGFSIYSHISAADAVPIATTTTASTTATTENPNANIAPASKTPPESTPNLPSSKPINRQVSSNKVLRALRQSGTYDRHLLLFDLRLQIGRSEQTLIARASALACAAICYFVTLIAGQNLAHIAVYRGNASMIQVTCVVLVGTAFELLMSRYISVIILRHKIGRYRRMKRERRSTMAVRSSHPEPSSTTTTKFATDSMPLTAVAQPSLSPHLINEPDLTMSGFDVWSTGMPDQQHFAQLLLYLVVFMTACHFSGW
ncbi:hypothetical protein BC828DRAFT_383951 [Blastocladiella britannica]|nr:hypothetical protein BC828DRAFT_383951 [Blastocladiella britannica]